MTESACDRGDCLSPCAQLGDATLLQARRLDFPMLAPRADGSRIVYLDNAATTQKPGRVIERITRFYASENSNRSATVSLYEEARERIAHAIGASARELRFVHSATSAISLVARGWGQMNIGHGDEIVVTELEHDANLAPWRELARAREATLRVAPVEDDGTLRAAAVERLLGPRTKLVALAHVSNVLGTRLPVAEIAAAAHRVGARVLVDGAQAVAHLAVDVDALGADFYAFSAHKAFGPTGIGALFVRGDLIEQAAWHAETGTPDIAGALGMAAAFEYLHSIGMDAIAAHERDLLAYAQARLQQLPGVRLVGTAADKIAIQSFVVDGLRPQDVRARLSRAGIEVQAGQFSTQPLFERLGIDSAVRVSIALYNTRADIDALVDALAGNAGAQE